MSTDSKYTIIEVCKLLNVTSYHIRNWEQKLKISFPKDENNKRFFTEKDLGILMLIKQKIDENYPISYIKEYINSINIQKKINSTDLNQLYTEVTNIVNEIYNKKEDSLKIYLKEQFNKLIQHQKKELRAQLKNKQTYKKRKSKKRYQDRRSKI